MVENGHCVAAVNCKILTYIFGEESVYSQKLLCGLWVYVSSSVV